MRMTTTFGINQVISHGFGLFLFAALVPTMQESISISYWYLTAIGALTQLSYLGGAMLLGLIGHRIDSGLLVLITGSITSTLLFTMSSLNDPGMVLITLTCMAASAAISWGAIVELITRYAPPELSSTCLSSASSGTAWGFSLNGLFILFIVPLLGWRNSWLLAGMLGAVTLILTFFLLKHLRSRNSVNSEETKTALSARQLFSVIFHERTAFLTCLVCLMVGFATVPFSTWLNTYLAELMLPPALGGYAWTVSGLTGMAAGFLTGKLADKKGHGIALLLIFSGFALGQLAFVYDPSVSAVLAGFGYGLMYFPMWGIIAAWVSRHYSSTATMQINGIGMVTFGLGGALGNLIAGLIQSYSGSLEGLYWLISVDSVLLVILAIYICKSETDRGKADSESYLAEYSQ